MTTFFPKPRRYYRSRGGYGRIDPDRMRPLRLLSLAVAVSLLLGIAGPGLAATPSDFYLDLLKKGVAEYDAARYDGAVTLLRVAAFGLLEIPSHYQTAQIYRAISADKLNDTAGTRDAAMRALAAERVQRSYSTLALPASVRTSFESVAKKVLTPADVSMLMNGPKPAPTKTEAPPKTAEAPKTEPAKTPTPKPQPPKSEPQKADPPKAEPKADPPKADPPKPDPPAPTRDVSAMFASAERSLNGGNLNEAKRVYRQLLDGTLTHEQAIRVAEGAYRARDFANVLRAFDRVGPLRKGEEPYRFYLAVALYESGRFAAAKKELATVLEFIEITPDVVRYKTKIENAGD